MMRALNQNQAGWSSPGPGWISFVFLFLSTALLPVASSFAQSSDISPSPGTPSTSEQLSLVNQLAEVAIADDTNFLGRTRFRIVPDKKRLAYDLVADPDSALLGKTNVLNVPLDALIRAQCLRRDFKREAANADFWVSPLAQVFQEANQTLTLLLNSTNSFSRKSGIENRAKAINESFAKLEVEIRQFAAQHALDIESQRSINNYFDVFVEAQPPRARIKYMTFLAYRESALPPPFGVPLDQQWNTLGEGHNQLIGRYHCIAVWPVELGGTETNDFVIRSNTRLVFHPPKQ